MAIALDHKMNNDIQPIFKWEPKNKSAKGHWHANSYSLGIWCFLETLHQILLLLSKEIFQFHQEKKNENLTGKQCTKMDIMLSLSIATQV